jgi:ferredoxin-type protein NapH
VNPRRRTQWTRWRRLVQFSIALFYVILPVLHLFEIRAIAGTLASLRIGPFDLTEPASGLTGALASRTFTTTLLIGVAPVVLLALVAGPVFCSWVCPWGYISEGIDRLRQRIVPAQWKGESWSISRWPRYLVLTTLVLLSVLAALPLVAILSAPRAITSLPLEMIYLRMISPLTAIVLLGVLAIELFAPRRIWCRVLCPVGTTAALLRTPKTLTIRWDESRCLCPKVAPCHVNCPWGVDPRKKSTHDACTNCMTCVDICPHASLAARLG